LSSIHSITYDFFLRQKSPEDFPEGDFRALVPKFSQQNFPHILNLVEGLRSVANAHDATPAQIAVAWLLAQGDDIIPIPGSKQISYNEENFEASKIRLNNEELKKIRELITETGKHLDEHGRTPDIFKHLNKFQTPPLPQ
jgi:aryl-alcohol dehydrogenase-like predicted oxidoreductase